MAPKFDLALAAGATWVAVAFALSTLDRWLRRRRPQELAWSISLALFALGSAALWWGMARGWSAASFRVFYLAGAILNVPWLALGTVYLLWGDQIGHRVRTALVFASGLAVGVMLSAPMQARYREPGCPRDGSCSACGPGSSPPSVRAWRPC